MSLGNDFFYEIRRRIPSLRKKAYAEQLPNSAWNLLGEGRLSLKQAGALSKTSLEQNLFYGEVFESLSLSFEAKSELHVLDVGSRHFVYAPALVRWLESRAGNAQISLSGLEVDPYQFYLDLYRRGDLGRYYAKVAETERSQVRYLEGDWLQFNVGEPYDLVTCFYPYLFDDLHRGDRLPQRAFDPFRFYSKLLTSADHIVLWHQGPVEYEASLKLLERFPSVSILEQFSVKETAYGARKHPVYVISLAV